MIVIHRTRPRMRPSTPRWAAKDSSSAAPSAVRRHTIAPSEKSSSATLMNMYDDPHTAAVATSMSHERRGIWVARVVAAACRAFDLLGQAISGADAAATFARTYSRYGS